MGTSANFANVGGVADVNVTAASTTGTIEEVLATYPLPANSLSANEKSLVIEAWFDGTGAGNKQVHLRFGGLTGTLIATMPVSTAAVPYKARATVTRTGASAQIAFGEAHASAVAPTFTSTTPAQAETGAINIVATATTATLGQITFKKLKVYFEN